LALSGCRNTAATLFFNQNPRPTLASESDGCDRN
jgi:hypothetical protein